MKLTVIVQGYSGSERASALEAGAFLVAGVLIDGQEVTAEEVLLNITPRELLTFTLRDAAPVGDGFDPDAGTELWQVSDGSLAGSPLEVEFREAPQ